MTWFNLFNKPITLHCYTSRADVYNFSPIQKASKFIPDWWKNTPKTTIDTDRLFSTPTIKTCAGFTGLYKKGFIIPMWSELALEMGKVNSNYYKYQYSDNISNIDQHDPQQRGPAYPPEKYQHLKIISPWQFVCNEDIDFSLTEPTWNIDTPEIVKILPGVVNYKYQSATNINTIWTRQDENVVYTIDHNQPLAHIIPLTEKQVNLKLHLISPADFANLSDIGRPLNFLNNYFKNKKILKAVEANGCPFHFKAEK